MELSRGTANDLHVVRVSLHRSTSNPLWVRNARWIDVDTDGKLNGVRVGTVHVDPVV
jgi:hypothetical protein